MKFYRPFELPEGAPEPKAFVIGKLREERLDQTDLNDAQAIPFYHEGCPVVEGEHQHGWSMCPDCNESWEIDWAWLGTLYAPTPKENKGKPTVR